MKDQNPHRDSASYSLPVEVEDLLKEQPAKEVEGIKEVWALSAHAQQFDVSIAPDAEQFEQMRLGVHAAKKSVRTADNPGAEKTNTQRYAPLRLISTHAFRIAASLVILVMAGIFFMSTSPTPVNGVQFGGLGNMVRDSLKGVQFGGVFNSAQSAQGVQFGGVFNTVYGDLDGYQFSGVLNQLGGDLEGGQFAGTVNTASNMRGAQFGGIANLADGRAKGVQASGIVNVAGDMAGTQMAGIANRANRKRGFQGAGVLNMSGPLRGAQAAGIANIAIGDFRGLQAAGIMNVAGNTRKGVQMSGILNVVDNMDGGVQIGLVNIANRNTGLPLGLLSYVKETGLKFDVWADEMGIVSTAVRSGNRSFSNYLGVAARPGESFDNQALMMGLGGEFALRPRLYSSVDVLYYLFGVESSNVSGPDVHLAKMRLLLGFKIAPRIAIFGGPSLNLFISDHQDTNVPVPSRLIHTGRWSGADYSVWAGYAFGLRISTKP